MVQRSLPTIDDPAASRSDVRLDQLVEQVRRRLVVADSGDTLQLVLDTMRAMASGVELGLTLEQIMRAVVGLTAAGRGTFEVLSYDAEVPRFIHVRNEHVDVPRRGATTGRRTVIQASDTPNDDGRLLALLHDASPVRLPDHAAYPGTDGRPPECRETHSFVGVQVRVGEEIFGRLYVTDKLDGDTFTAYDVGVVQVLAARAGIAIQFRRGQLYSQALCEITTELLTGNPAEQVLPLVAERAMALLRADAAFITLARADSAAPGVDIGAHAGLTDEQVAALAGAAADPFAAPPAGFGAVLRGWLHSAGARIGELVALRLDGSEEFDPEERVLLESFVDHASLVLEVHAKQDAHRRLGIRSDRDRIARDLHDHVIQRLFAVGLTLQGTLQRVTDPDVRQRIERCVDQLDETVQEIRTSIFDLHMPSEQSPTSLRRRLLDTVADVCHSSALSPSTHFVGPIDTVVPVRLGDQADAVVREAVTNVLRHAGATRLAVRVEATDELVLTVEDDGAGIPDGARRSGLRNLAHRADQCGGSFEITPGTGGGTRLRWRAPLGD